MEVMATIQQRFGAAFVTLLVGGCSLDGKVRGSEPPIEAGASAASASTGIANSTSSGSATTDVLPSCTDGECEDGSVCLLGFCRSMPPPCHADGGDCPMGTVCTHGIQEVCTDCPSDHGCLLPTLCDTISGAETCSSNDNLEAGDDTAERDASVATSSEPLDEGRVETESTGNTGAADALDACDESQDCDDGSLCLLGFCRTPPPSCSLDGGACPPGLVCADGLLNVCADCPSDFGCLPPTLCRTVAPTAGCVDESGGDVRMDASLSPDDLSGDASSGENDRPSEGALSEE